MVLGRLPQRRRRRALRAILQNGSTAHGQPDMNTLHLILPKASPPLMITEELIGSLVTRRVMSLKQESSRGCCAGRRPVVAYEGNFINTMKRCLPTML
jgi:hypothetical protein